MKQRNIWRSGVSVLLAAFLFMGSFAASALGEEQAASDPIGYSAEAALQEDPSTSEQQWENITTLLDGGIFEADNWYKIDSVAGMNALATLVNEDWRTTIKVYLAADIIYPENATYTVIGRGAVSYEQDVPSRIFNGIFNGCGYRIDGINMVAQKPEKEPMEYAALFGAVGANAKISNLVIGENCSFSAVNNNKYTCTAGLAGRVIEGAIIENVMSLATVSGGYASGGLIARVDHRAGRGVSASIKNCTNAGSVNGTYGVGGIIGIVCGNVEFSNCENYGTVNSSTTIAYVGGLFGCIKTISQYENVENYLENWEKVSQVTLSNSSNHGNLSSVGAAGAIAGYVGNSEIDGVLLATLTATNCNNSGTISVAGQSPWIGSSVQPIEVTSCIDRSGMVRLHGSQIRTTASTQNTYAVRFVGSVSHLNYSEIGFLVEIEWNGRTAEQTLRCKTVFEHLGSSDSVVYTAEELTGKQGTYLYALTLNDIPLNSGKVVFHVTPYGINGDQTEYGDPFEMIYQDGNFVPEWTRSIAA